jgi:hypothetical protein
MAEIESADWQKMATAPRDGTRILVLIRASEQGAAEVDVVRWLRSPRTGEEGWVAIDSDSGARFVYAEGELQSWMPLPAAMPRGAPSRRSATPDPDVVDGGGI